MAIQKASNDTSAADADRQMKTAVRSMWALGDYHAFARATVWEVGPVIVEACRIAPGQRVLDVAAGTGNVAIRAALAGAEVVACDLTPEQFEAGRRAARDAGVEITWVEGDAEQLPFDPGEFDVVTSCFGAMFAPDQQRVADELVRVCRPGGTIGLASFTPDGSGGAFFDLLGPYVPPPPPDAVPAVMWGDEAHVRALFGERVTSLVVEPREYVERASSPAAYLELFTRTFGPMIAIYGSLADQPARIAALERDFFAFVDRCNRDGADGSVAIPYQYLLTVARTRA